jgi:hypothetical protein
LQLARLLHLCFRRITFGDGEKPLRDLPGFARS